MLQYATDACDAPYASVVCSIEMLHHRLRDGGQSGGNGAMRIAIVGPGRSGTTFLVELFSAWGLSTPEGDYAGDAQAGREARLGSSPHLEVEKDPWAFEYINEMSPQELLGYDAFLIPIRNASDAARSRSVQERLHRTLVHVDDQWRWNTWGTVPGGAVSRTAARDIQGVLAEGVWTVVLRLAEVGVQPKFLHFPRIVSDFDYLWGIVGDIVGSRISREEARETFATVSDISKVRSTPGDDVAQVPDARELVELVDLLRRKVREMDERARHAEDRLGGSHGEIVQLTEQIGTLEKKIRILEDKEAAHDRKRHRWRRVLRAQRRSWRGR